jgi:MFS family permease
MSSGDVNSPRLSPLQWRIFTLACGTSLLLYVHRYSWNLVGPMIQGEFGLSSTQTGFLFSLFYYTYAIAQIPSGVVIDRFGARRFLSAIILAWSVAIAAIGQAASSRAILGPTAALVLVGVLRLAFGMAQAGCYPALTKVSAGWFHPARRTLLQGLIATTAGRGGGALGPIITGTVLMGWLHQSWEAALGILGIVGCLYGVLFWYAYLDPPTRREDSEPGPSPAPIPVRPATLPWGRAWRNNSLRFFTLQMFLDAGSDVVYVSLIGTYFLTARGFDVARTGWLASLPLWGGALGGVVGGWLNDHLIARTGNRRWSRSGVGCVGKLIACLMLILTVRQSSGVGAALCMFVAKFFSDWSQPTTWGTCTDLGGRFSATVFSIVNTAGTVASVVTPIVFGQVLDRFTTHASSAGHDVATTDWGPFFLVLTAMYLASGLLWLLVDCTKRIEGPGDPPLLHS